uniref:Uncharacterized protein n=1 Tax=Anguilla anguilla TaxID=7936 RepID=A0A0E9XGP5_ANGAN
MEVPRVPTQALLHESIQSPNFIVCQIWSWTVISYSI